METATKKQTSKPKKGPTEYDKLLKTFKPAVDAMAKRIEQQGNHGICVVVTREDLKARYLACAAEAEKITKKLRVDLKAARDAQAAEVGQCRAQECDCTKNIAVAPDQIAHLESAILRHVSVAEQYAWMAERLAPGAVTLSVHEVDLLFARRCPLIPLGID